MLTEEEEEELIYEQYTQFKRKLWTWMEENCSELPVELGAVFVTTAGLTACINVFKMPVDKIIEAATIMMKDEHQSKVSIV